MKQLSLNDTRKHTMSKISELLTCQQVLTITVFFGFFFHHMLRINISIAIVEMVTKNSSNSTEALGPRYDWNEEERNDILGYFFWGYVLTQIPGGRLSEMYGTKIVVGVGILTASILTILTPLAASLNYYLLIVTRLLLGVSMGIHWPSTPPIATKWIAPEDVSKFMSHMVASSLGVALTLPVCGYLIAYWGWPSVFYVTGTIALVWSLCWFGLVYDTPDQHPRISKEEKEKLGNEVRIKKREKAATPWVKILTSGPVWAIITANTCQGYTFFICFNQLPTYMSEVLHFNIKQNGLLSSFPYLARYFTSLISALVADHIIKSRRFSTTAIRKFFTVSLFLGTGLLFSAQAFWGYNRIVSIVVFTGCLGLMGFATPGFYANNVDVAPAYSGTILGIAQVPACLVGYVGTKIVAFFTKDDMGFEQWIYIFWILVGVNVFGAVVFLIFASGEEQSWSSSKHDIEIEKLNSDTSAAEKT